MEQIRQNKKFGRRLSGFFKIKCLNIIHIKAPRSINSIYLIGVVALLSDEITQWLTNFFEAEDGGWHKMGAKTDKIQMHSIQKKSLQLVIWLQYTKANTNT